MGHFGGAAHEAARRLTMAAPRFSVLTAVYDPQVEHLDACLASVEAQTTSLDFEHVVVDDCSTDEGVRRVLHSREHPAWRRVMKRGSNGGVVAASNDALTAASGDIVVLLDHDDVLVPGALERLAEAFRDGVDVVYSDHDLIRGDGRVFSPVYNPDFSLERLRNHNYITHLVAVRRSVMDDIGGFRPGTDGSQDHDVLLRLAERVGPFRHVPEILAHWRQSDTSISGDATSNAAAVERQLRLTEEHLQRCGVAATVTSSDHVGVARIHREIAGTPTVSVVIPTRGSRARVWGVERILIHRAVESLIAANDDRVRLEIVVVLDLDTARVVERGLAAIAGEALKIVTYPHEFNFSDKVNRGVAAATGEYVLLLNDDTELIEPGSVSEMVGISQMDDVGMVGAKLLYEDGTLQHAGHVYHGTISHAFLGWPGDHPGPHRMLVVERECAGVTAAAAMMRREVFDRVGGMNLALPANYNDVDLSLTVRSAGYRIIWTPHASWYHFEQKSFDHPIEQTEIDEINRRWGDYLWTDPYANPNLTPGRTDLLELPMRSGAAAR
jgi:GT2 family glycosyltransferase